MVFSFLWQRWSTLWTMIFPEHYFAMGWIEFQQHCTIIYSIQCNVLKWVELHYNSIHSSNHTTMQYNVHTTFFIYIGASYLYSQIFIMPLLFSCGGTFQWCATFKPWVAYEIESWRYYSYFYKLWFYGLTWYTHNF